MHNDDGADFRAIEEEETTLLAALKIPTIEVRLGTELAAMLLSPGSTAAVLRRSMDGRREVAHETGIIVSGVQWRDDRRLDPMEYAVYIRGQRRGRYTIRRNSVLAMGNTAMLSSLPGEDTRDPVYRCPARWVPREDQEIVRGLGGMTFDPLGVIISHCMQSVRNNLAVVFDFQQFLNQCEALRKKANALITEVFAAVTPLGVYRVYHRLLREGVWPRDYTALMNALLIDSALTSSPIRLAESARKAVVPTQLARKKSKSINALAFSPELEQEIRSSLTPDTNVNNYVLRSLIAEKMHTGIENDPAAARYLIAPPDCRLAIANIALDAALPIKILATDEIPPSKHIVISARM